MEKKVLILEDDENRIQQFKANFLAAKNENMWFNLYITKDVLQAIEWVETIEFDMVFLDHDLCDAHYGGYSTKELTGEDFARFLGDNPEIAAKQGMYVVHSLNSVGAENMMNHLRKITAPKQKVKIPFVWKTEIFKKTFSF